MVFHQVYADVSEFVLVVNRIKSDIVTGEEGTSPPYSYWDAGNNWLSKFAKKLICPSRAPRYPLSQL